MDLKNRSFLKDFHEGRRYAHSQISLPGAGPRLGMKERSMKTTARQQPIPAHEASPHLLPHCALLALFLAGTPAESLAQTGRPAVASGSTIQKASATFVTFDVSGASAFIGTFGISINDFGEIAGFYSDQNYAARPFLRSPNGTLTEFDVPGDVNGLLTYSGTPAINLW
ncbi:MAG: hypothetical protein JO022_13015, partial [Acidobacteriaceae bacterium]|nr:hypothetical protein [Acidobacteriaceae bacterium]